MKQCTKCKETKALGQFGKRRYRSGTVALHSWCKSCHRQVADAYKQRFYDQGLCVCGQPLKEGHASFCIACSEKRKPKYENRKAAGLCVGSPSCAEPPEGVLCVKHKDANKWRRIKAMYGLERAEYMARIEQQNYKCPITGDSISVPKGELDFETGAVVDHNHDTGNARGMLSNRANVILGLLDEDPELIRKVADNMIAYLEKWAAVKAA